MLFSMLASFHDSAGILILCCEVSFLHSVFLLCFLLDSSSPPSINNNWYHTKSRQQLLRQVPAIFAKWLLTRATSFATNSASPNITLSFSFPWLADLPKHNVADDSESDESQRFNVDPDPGGVTRGYEAFRSSEAEFDIDRVESEPELGRFPEAEDDDLSDLSEPLLGKLPGQVVVLSKSSSPVLTPELMPPRIENLTLGLRCPEIK